MNPSSGRRPFISQPRIGSKHTTEGKGVPSPSNHFNSEEESLVGIRESLNKNPSITTGVTIGIIVIALLAIVWQMWSSRPNINNIKSFYTVDDGKTWFEDQATKNPPFDYKGSPAYRAYVFKCGDSGKPFVAYMERFTPDALKKLEAAAANPTTSDPMAM